MVELLKAKEKTLRACWGLNKAKKEREKKRLRVIWNHWTSTINALSRLVTISPLSSTHTTHTIYYHAPITHMPTIATREAHLHTLAYTLTHTYTSGAQSVARGTTSVRLHLLQHAIPKTNTHTHADSDGEAHEPRAWCVWVFLRVWTHSYHCPTGKRQDCSGRTGGWTQVLLCLEGHYGGKGSRVLEIKDHTVTVTC